MSPMGHRKAAILIHSSTGKIEIIKLHKKLFECFLLNDLFGMILFVLPSHSKCISFLALTIKDDLGFKNLERELSLINTLRNLRVEW